MEQHLSKRRQSTRALLMAAALGALIALAAILLTTPLPSAAWQPPDGDNGGIVIPPGGDPNPLPPQATPEPEAPQGVVTVKPVTLNITEDESATYSVVLDRQPAWEVSIIPSSGDEGAVTVNPSSRIFTTDNWKTPQSFTVNGVTDEDDRNEKVRISHRAASLDSRYNGIAVASVDVNVTDIMPGNFSISSTASAAEGEDVTLTVTLTAAAPAGGVTFGVSAAFEAGAGKAERSDAGDVPRTVTVASGGKTAVLTIPISSDALNEGDETFAVTITPPAGWTTAASGDDKATVTITDVAPPAPEPEPEKQVVEPELPGPVVNLELSATTDSVTVTWQAPASGGAADNYIVHLRPKGGGEGSGKTHRPLAGKHSTTFRHLESGATYKVWARAQNAAGKGERTHASIILPEPALELPGPVVNLQLSATEGSVTVSWQAPESGGSPDGYIAHLKAVNGVQGSGKTRYPGTGKTSIVYRELEFGQTYNVWVRAHNEGGKGERVRASITLP